MAGGCYASDFEMYDSRLRSLEELVKFRNKDLKNKDNTVDIDSRTPQNNKANGTMAHINRELLLFYSYITRDLICPHRQLPVHFELGITYSNTNNVPISG